MFFCKSPDSIDHTFLACSVAEDIFYEIMTWFNNEQKSQINTPNANMADHSVGARDELHESEDVRPRCFVLAMLPLKSLALWTA